MQKPTLIWPSHLPFLSSTLFRYIPGNSTQSKLASSLSSLDGVSNTLLLLQCCRTHSSCTEAIWGTRRLEGTSGVHLEHPAQRRSLEQVVNIMSNQVLNISKDRDCTTCSGVRQLLILSWDFLFSSLCLLPAVLFCTPNKRTLSSLYFSVRKWFPAVGITEMNFIITVNLLKT